MRYILLPQAIVRMLPTFGNNAIELLKGTAVVSLISLSDMTFQAQLVRAQTGNTVVPIPDAYWLSISCRPSHSAASHAVSSGICRAAST